MQNDKNIELLNSMIVEKAIAELESETDKLLACKKALITLILLTQDDSSLTFERYILYLLKKFEPINEGFINNTHEFIFEEGIMRAMDANQKIKLFFSENLFKKLVEEYSKKN